MSRSNMPAATNVAFLMRCTILCLALAAALPAASQSSFTTLHKFATWPLGIGPYSRLVADAAGNLYGTTATGGSSYCNQGQGCGAVFQLTRGINGSWVEKVIYSFSAGSANFQPGDLAIDSAGNLYGVTFSAAGGNTSDGLIFKLSSRSNGTWSKSTVYQFSGFHNGTGPSGLVLDASGNLYGTTTYSGISEFTGAYGCGELFEMSPGSNGFWTRTTLYTFGTSTDACGPKSSLIFDSAGNLYATSVAGGVYGNGTVFELSPSTGTSWTETAIYSFTGQLDGAQPIGLVLDRHGNPYGVTGVGGIPDRGTVFAIVRGAGGWSKRTLYQFQGGADAERPVSIAMDAAGNLYGAAFSGGGTGGQQQCPGGCGAIFQLTPSGSGAWTESVIFSFTGNAGGAFPDSELLVDTAGNIFGDTQNGGSTGCDRGCGTVFELRPGSGTNRIGQVIANFPSQDGGYAEAALVMDSQGNFYGTTTQGGDYDYGTVFQISPSSNGQWTRTILHSFQGGTSDGELPLASLILDGAGNLYGTTFYGGNGVSLQCGSIACGNGTVFKLAPGANGKWTETVIYRFAGGSDGINPAANLMIDKSGNLYGTTQAGGGTGTECAGFGCGTVFELSPGANGLWTKKVIYNFTGPDNSDGWFPCSWLVADQAGNLYGTTEYGGGEDIGTVFKLSPNSGGWNESVLYSFQYSSIDGNRPYAGLTFDGSGNLYGTTLLGGPGECLGGGDGSCGSVFELSPAGSNWTEKVLYFFQGLLTSPPDGGFPQGGVVLDKNGNLYGTTYAGGASSDTYLPGYGMVYELSPSAGGNWSETALHNFEYTDGMYPEAGVILDLAGNLYGTTYYAGVHDVGTVYKLTHANGKWTETVLYSFKGGNDGSSPISTLVSDKAGNLYGTTSDGGTSCACGVIFKLAPNANGSWTESVPYRFPGAPAAGFAYNGMVVDSAGNFYGATTHGGASNDGAIYKFTP